MARFHNDTGSVLTVNDLGRDAGPYEEFDWPGYDPEVHGPVAGCTWLDAPEPATPDPGDDTGTGTGAPQNTGDTADDSPPARGKRPKGTGAEQDKETSE